MHFSFSTIFSFSRQIPRPTVFISHFPRFVSFFPIFQFLQYAFLIYHDFHVSGHIPSPTVCICHCSRFTVFLTIFQVIQCAFLIFHVFQFSRHIPGPTVFVSFSTSFQFSSHKPGPTVCISHFSSFSQFLAIFQVLQCVFLIFHLFQFSHYIIINKVSISLFPKFFSVSRHIPCPTVCISHFSRFSVFLDVFQILQCRCFIFHVFQFSCHIPGPTVCISHFSRFSVFLAIFQVIQCLCLIFHCFHFLAII